MFYSGWMRDNQNTDKLKLILHAMSWDNLQENSNAHRWFQYDDINVNFGTWMKHNHEWSMIHMIGTGKQRFTPDAPPKHLNEEDKKTYKNWEIFWCYLFEDSDHDSLWDDALKPRTVKTVLDEKEIEKKNKKKGKR